MLAGHVRFLAQKKPTAARKVKNELMDAIRSLKEIPERFLVFGGRIYPA
jgi:plasmid stabilization system protein ParE